MTIENLSILRHYIDEQSTDIYGDQFLLDVIERSAGNLDLAASEIWGMKAARFAKLVNVSESGSQRALGDKVKNAHAMAAYYYAKATAGTGGEVPGGTAGARSGTRKIERATS